MPVSYVMPAGVSAIRSGHAAWTRPLRLSAFHTFSFSRPVASRAITVASPRWKWSPWAWGNWVMTVSPSGVGLDAPGICAIACSKVRVRNCKGLSLAGLAFGGMARPGADPKENGRDHTVPAASAQKRYFVLVVPAAAEPAPTPMSATKTKSERNAGPIIVGIGIRIVIGRRRRAIRIAITGRRAVITGRRRAVAIITRALVLVHAGIIGVAISGLHVVGRMA